MPSAFPLSPAAAVAVAAVAFVLVAAVDIGPETCGQDRILLANWFLSHGDPSKLLLEPYPPLFFNATEDPYADPSNPPLAPDQITGFCGMQWSEETDAETGFSKYRLGNFTTEQEAAASGFTVTHAGHCGACSSMQDLGAYLRRNLTTPTRICGALGAVSEDLEWRCLKWLGFSDECAHIWHWNILNTKSKCFRVCLIAWITDAPNNNPDGSLNDCLQCDEDESGPNFKYFSGRTRRNSGIPSAIYRPPEQIYNMSHCYWYGELNTTINELSAVRLTSLRDEKR